jgi:hypothetical protein
MKLLVETATRDACRRLPLLHVVALIDLKKTVKSTRVETLVDRAQTVVDSKA